MNTETNLSIMLLHPLNPNLTCYIQSSSLTYWEGQKPRLLTIMKITISSNGPANPMQIWDFQWPSLLWGGQKAQRLLTSRIPIQDVKA